MPAYYRATFLAFSSASDSEVLGHLAQHSKFDIVQEQRDAWQDQLPVLRDCVSAFLASIPESQTWSLLLEYPVPRLGHRIDAVILSADLIFVLEFKTGLSGRAALAQVEDYALSLACFHEHSRDRSVIPVAVTRTGKTLIKPTTDELIRASYQTSEGNLPEVLLQALRDMQSDDKPRLDARAWDEARFLPIPSIIDAALALYNNMDVFEIGHACSSQESLQNATEAISKVISRARDEKEKIICFVTGVPGSGKTLIGLNVVHQQELRSKASFLSGNGPLIAVLKEALIRDEVKRTKKKRKDANLAVKAFIHNMHHFAEEYYGEPTKKPVSNVVVYDEAQRAWDKNRNKKKFKRPISEPELLLEIMGRLDWAVIVALVGGGQEINTGEAGLTEWGRALIDNPKWKIVASPEVLTGGDSTAGMKLFETDHTALPPIATNADLHLTSSLRSIRSMHHSKWVNEVLSGNLDGASETAELSDFQPLYLVRDLPTARNWLLSKRRGNSRAGLVASAFALRLRADGMEVSPDFLAKFKWDKWFLNEMTDIRSSSALEVAASQFKIQGLELDWVGLCWGDDLIWDGTRWRSSRLCYPKDGTRWSTVNEESPRHQFTLNGYRVLLTRARRQTLIYVPRVLDTSDRLSTELDATADFLQRAGVRPIDI